MPDNSPFAEWLNSPYYYLLYDAHNTERVSFINALIEKLQPAPESKILHLGCGTGQYTKVISETGLDVTGIDFSFEAIGQASQFENDRLHFYQHDLRYPFWMHYFHYAIHLFTPFAYYKTVRDYDNSIRTVSQSLQDDGLVIMDCLNVHYEEDHLEQVQEKTVGDVNFRITSRQDDENFYKQIQVKEHGLINYLFAETIIKFSIGDYTDMFAYQGLQIQEVFGDYDFSGYDIRRSPRLIFIARKLRR